ncbi:MAG: hypothetical protein PHV06_04135 [bacterium]|nr:hypothetical protein [bacterium]
MYRRIRIDKKNYFYYISIKGQRNQPLFFSNYDIQKYIRFFNEIQNKHDLEIYAYCFTKTEALFLIKRKLQELHKFFHKLNTKYALYFNGKYKAVGYVFQDRYNPFIVLNEKYLPILIKHIHSFSKFQDVNGNINTYKFTSIAFYEGSTDPNFFKIKKIEVFKNHRNYEKFIASNRKSFPIYKNSIGEKNDYLCLEKRRNGIFKPVKKERRGVSPLLYKEATLILNKNDLKLDDIRSFSYSRDKQKQKIRLHTIKKLINLGFTKSQIAELFLLSKSSISKILKQ